MCACACAPFSFHDRPKRKNPFDHTRAPFNRFHRPFFYFHFPLGFDTRGSDPDRKHINMHVISFPLSNLFLFFLNKFSFKFLAICARDPSALEPSPLQSGLNAVGDFLHIILRLLSRFSLPPFTSFLFLPFPTQTAEGKERNAQRA